MGTSVGDTDGMFVGDTDGIGVGEPDDDLEGELDANGVGASVGNTTVGEGVLLSPVLVGVPAGVGEGLSPPSIPTPTPIPIPSTSTATNIKTMNPLKEKQKQ